MKPLPFLPFALLFLGIATLTRIGLTLYSGINKVPLSLWPGLFVRGLGFDLAVLVWRAGMALGSALAGTLARHPRAWPLAPSAVCRRQLFEPGLQQRHAFISNYQELGYLKDDRLVVLGPKRRVDTFSIDAAGDARPIATDEKLRDEAVAYNQSAFLAFKQGKLKLKTRR